MRKPVTQEDGRADPNELVAAGSCPEALDLGCALAVQHRHVSEVSEVACRALCRLTGESEWKLVYELTGLFALWAADLPASERHHHRHPFGLFEHSTEVAATVASDLDRRWHAGRGARVLTAGERAMWARVGYAAALFHDVGKVRDVIVREPASGAEWDPLREPLARFKRRWNRAFGDPSPFRYRAGRGLWGHEASGVSLVRVILAAGSSSGLAPLVPQLLSVYTNRHQLQGGESIGPAGYFAVRISEADVASSRSGWDGTGRSGRGFFQKP